MNRQRLQFLLYACLFSIISLTSINAQAQLAQPDMYDRLNQAKAFLSCFKNDSALVVLTELIEEVADSNQDDTPLGLRIRFRYAEALEKDLQSEKALERLLLLQKLGREKEVWDVYTKSSIILARLYERIGRKKDCLQNLRKAEAVMQQYSELDSIYPHFCLRLSSYHRIYEDVDSAMFYAQEVLRTAPIYRQLEEEAVGHMLMGMLIEDTNSKERLDHFKAAARTFKTTEDYTGYGYMARSVAGWYLENGDLQKALLYSDSTIEAGVLSIANGHEDHFILAMSYRFRGEVFRQMGALDSAWHYLKKGYEMELDYIHELNNENVIEIDARYKDEQKAQRIIEQEKQIIYERDRRLFLIGIISMVVFFLSVLAYYYIKLRRANQKTKVQALTIAKNNRDLSSSLRQQLVLQGEVHHRVKNNLQVIISLLDLQKEDITDMRARKNLETMSKRIYSMAAIHEILYQQDDKAEVNLFHYIENLCMHFSHFSLEANKPEFTIEVEEVFFNLETSMPVGIMLTELLTNSLKYARVEGQKLKISMVLKKEGEGYKLIYRDNGPGFSKGSLKEREGGLGTYLLKSMTRQLNGHIESRNEGGAFYKIFFKEKNKIR